jgi:hypothetical protein
MPTPDRVAEILANCRLILKECIPPDYIPDFAIAAEAQIKLLQTPSYAMTPSFQDYGPERHGQIMGEKQEG